MNSTNLYINKEEEIQDAMNKTQWSVNLSRKANINLYINKEEETQDTMMYGFRPTYMR